MHFKLHSLEQQQQFCMIELNVFDCGWVKRLLLYNARLFQTQSNNKFRETERKVS